MKYTVSNIINKPIEEVVAKFKDPESVKHWMEGLQKVELISGTAGEIGAVTDLHSLFKKKEMIIRETILESNPNQMKFSYQSSMGTNIVEIQFEENSNDTTHQISHTEMKMNGPMKIMGFLFKGMFKKFSMKYLNAFKKYAEYRFLSKLF